MKHDRGEDYGLKQCSRCRRWGRDEEFELQDDVCDACIHDVFRS